MSDEVKKDENASENAGNSESTAQMEKLRAELEKYKNDYLYLRADFDNYKKNVIKERADYIKYGCERVFVELLEVVDNFDRALSYEITPDKIESFVKGIRLIQDELKLLLTKFNVIELPAYGEKFDPNIHNALGTEPTDQVPSGHVSKVLKKPYKLHERTIRPAQVIIATAASTQKEK